METRERILIIYSHSIIDKFKFTNFTDNALEAFVEKDWQGSYSDSLPDISFIYLDQDTFESRVTLRKTINHNKQANHVLVSPKTDLAMLAWQANLMAFMPYNQTEPALGLKVLTDRIKRYPPNVTVAQNKLKINYKGGFDLVDLDHICFCSGSGNYTEIYLQNGKKKCISYPLSKIEQRLKGVTFLDRIGKSFIINYNRVQSVKSELVVFRGEATFELNLSKTYIKRIKQNLLWY